MLSGFELYPRWVPLDIGRRMRLDQCFHFLTKNAMHCSHFDFSKKEKIIILRQGRKEEGPNVISFTC